MTYFKPGDIIVNDHNKKVVYLILKVNSDMENYITFVLSHVSEEIVGEKLILRNYDYTFRKLIEVKL